MKSHRVIQLLLPLGESGVKVCDQLLYLAHQCLYCAPVDVRKSVQFSSNSHKMAGVGQDLLQRDNTANSNILYNKKNYISAFPK